MGTPQELTDDDGNVVWCNYEWAWGGRYTHFYKEQSLNGKVIQEFELQPIKFQGQSLDIETGLHYNRFRYYDSDVGMFIQRDPIGLLGGNNVFQYAPNPVGWVDPWGLSGYPATEGLTTEPYILFDKEYKNSRPRPRGLGPNNGYLQAHHGLQKEWAINNIPNYNPNLAPSITLETGKGYPHTQITNAQNSRRDARVSSKKGKWSSTLNQELKNIVKDLKSVGFSQETIDKVMQQQYKMLDKLGVKYSKVCTK